MTAAYCCLLVVVGGAVMWCGYEELKVLVNLRMKKIKTLESMWSNVLRVDAGCNAYYIGLQAGYIYLNPSPAIT